MSAKHALLGLLLDRPAYRYELGDRLQARLGPTWAINSGQVYQTIKNLQREGLIELVEDPAGSERRLFYAINKQGVQEFERWWSEEGSGARLSRRPLLVKVSLGGPQRLKDALGQIDAYERDCAERLREVTRRRDEVPVGGAKVRADHVLLSLGLSGDIFQLEGELRWARHAHDVVSWLLNREAIWPGARGQSSTELERDRQEARQELFGRIAAKHRRLEPEPGEGP